MKTSTYANLLDNGLRESVDKVIEAAGICLKRVSAGQSADLYLISPGSIDKLPEQINAGEPPKQVKQVWVIIPKKTILQADRTAKLAESALKKGAQCVTFYFEEDVLGKLKAFYEPEILCQETAQ